MRFRKRNLAWLSILGALVAMVILAGAAQPQVAIALVGLYLAAVAATVLELQPRKLLESVPQSPLTMMRMSAQAREASERARRRTSYTPPGLTLLDVGLISLQASSEGMVMRRSRSISLDENGVRPYITLHVDSAEADRQAVVRFEILDQDGTPQYIHEMKTRLRDGEMNILADHQLPLSGNERLSGAGDWDLRVSVDGALLGVLSFTTTPSISGRNQALAKAANDPVYRLSDEAAEDSPVSLQDLLRAASSKNPGQRQ